MIIILTMKVKINNCVQKTILKSLMQSLMSIILIKRQNEKLVIITTLFIISSAFIKYFHSKMKFFMLMKSTT